jgi:putative glutathione S-transferase
MRGIGETIDFYHIKTHYFTSHPNLNFYAIVPRGDVCGAFFSP